MTTAQAKIMDECVHGMTAAWCSLCKSFTTGMAATGISVSRVTRPSWESVVDDLPAFPRALAQFDGECPWCGDDILKELDHVFLRGGEWLCQTCAEDYETPAPHPMTANPMKTSLRLVAALPVGLLVAAFHVLATCSETL